MLMLNWVLSFRTGQHKVSALRWKGLWCKEEPHGKKGDLQHVSTHILSSGNSDCGQSGKQISVVSGWMGLKGVLWAAKAGRSWTLCITAWKSSVKTSKVWDGSIFVGNEYLLRNSWERKRWSLWQYLHLLEQGRNLKLGVRVGGSKSEG